jgi:hypothetical protein
MSTPLAPAKHFDRPVWIQSPRDMHSTLIAYLLDKAQQRDWHGVSDAANDLRVLEAEHPELKQ